MKKTEGESQKNKVYVTTKESCVFSLQPSPQGINFVIVNNNIISLQQGDYFYITLFDRPNLQHPVSFVKIYLQNYIWPYAINSFCFLLAKALGE